jgi:hypothetical protein
MGGDLGVGSGDCVGIPSCGDVSIAAAIGGGGMDLRIRRKNCQAGMRTSFLKLPALFRLAGWWAMPSCCVLAESGRIFSSGSKNSWTMPGAL